MLQAFASELCRVLVAGRIACFVTDDMLVNRARFPIGVDKTRIMLDTGFRYRDRIVWVKSKGHVRISRRSEVVGQDPCHIYYYPDNIQESILIFQKAIAQSVGGAV